MKSAEDWLHTVRRFMNEDSLDTYVDSKRDVLPATEFMRLLTAAEHRRVEIRTGKLFDKIPKGLFRQLQMERECITVCILTTSTRSCRIV